MNIMVNAIAPILKWTDLKVHMIKSQCTGINHATGTQISETTEAVLELFLLRLNEQGLEISCPWESDHDESLIEVLWPRLYGAWLEKSRWTGCRELDASVHATWVAAKNCLHACKKLGNAGSESVPRFSNTMATCLRTQKETVSSVS
jgi:hypothetical protein